VYQLPLLVALGLPPLRSFQQAFLLSLANPSFTILLSFVMMLVSAVSVATLAPLALFAPVFLSSMGAGAVTALVRKYEALERS
jgi:hypothetical protein